MKKLMPTLEKWIGKPQRTASHTRFGIIMLKFLVTALLFFTVASTALGDIYYEKVGTYTFTFSIETNGCARICSPCSIDELKLLGPDKVVPGVAPVPTGKLIIPALLGDKKVDSIGLAAFANCRDVVQIVIPDEVVHIGEGAFYGCTNLIDITLPKALKEIKDGAFYKCRNLKNLLLPEKTKYLGEKLVHGCDALEHIKIPASLASACNFSNLKGLKSVWFDDGVRHISSAMFSGCENITEVRLPSSLRSIGSGAFQNCKGLEKISLPDGMDVIEAVAFQGCSQLETCRIPRSVSFLDATAFEETNLDFVKADDGAVWTDGWIVKWDSPNSVNIVFKKGESPRIARNAMNISPCKFNITYDSSLYADECAKKLEEIGGGPLFWNPASTNIQEIVINSPIRTLESKSGFSFFKGCVGLRKIVLPDTVTNIPYAVFDGCVNLDKITFPKDYIPPRVHDYLPAGCTNLLHNVAYKDEESMVGALAYMELFYEDDLLKQDDRSDGYVGDYRFKAVLKRLNRYVAEHPNCYTIEMQNALRKLSDTLFSYVVWPVDNMKRNDFTPIYMLLSGEKSEKQKIWDSLSDEAKQELFVRARYNMVQVCELFANAYDFPYACKCLLDYWIDGNATFKRVDMYKRMARYYARVMTLYAKGSDGYTGAKDEMLGCLQKISDMGYERQAELLQIELERGIAPKDSQSVVKKSCTGTGWFFNSNHVATCWHVIDGCKSISIEVDGVKFPAQVVAKDTANDIADLRIGQCNVRHTYLPIKARVAKISDKVFTIGYPLASILGQAQKYTEGTVSAVSGIGNDGRYYQISTPIQPGNSGGALVDERGNVVGLTSSALNAIKTATIVGALPQNVNYAIKVRYLVALLEDSSIYFSVDDVAHNDRQQLVEYVSAATVLIIAE